jgi:PKD repeat protein
MSQRTVFRALFLSILAVLVAVPAAAEITFSPGVVSFAVGETSPLVTAQVVFEPDQDLPGGLHTLDFGYGQVLGGPGGVGILALPDGLSTIPSPVTFTTAPGQTSATVSFQIVAQPWAYTGFQEVPVYSNPTYAYGLLNYEVRPVSVQPKAVSVVAGQLTDPLQTTIGLGYSYPQGPLELVFSGLPTGAAPNPDPVTFTVQFENDVAYAVVPFRISTDPSTPPGTYEVAVGYDFQFVATFGGGGRIRPLEVISDTFLLTVEPAAVGSLGVTAEKASLDVCPGGAAVANSVLIEALDGYEGAPTVTFPMLPSDLQVTPSSIAVDFLPPSRTVAFEVSAVAGARPGPKTVNVLVKDPRGPAGFTSFVVNVGAADFAPAVSPASLTLTAGGAAGTVTAGLVPGACAAPPSITVTPSGLPPGVTASPVSGVLLAPSFEPVVFTFSAAGSAPEGTVTASILFEPSTGTAKSAPVIVSVLRTGRIGVEVERASVDVCPGGADGPNTLTITTLDGYTGAPTVTFPGLPAGLSVFPDVIEVPVVPPARLVPFVVRAAPGTPAGPATVTALVSDFRGIETAVTFVANVLPGDFTPVVPSTVLVLNAGGASASLPVSAVAGSCVPTSGIVVTPSGLPPGVSVTPASAVLAPPAFAPAGFAFQASSSAAAGPSTITFTFTPASGPAKTATATVAVCGPPDAPVSPVVRPQGNPQGPVTATDVLDLSWGAPGSGFVPTRYEWRINGGPWNGVAATSAKAPPRGAVDPVQLFVRGFACDPEKGPGAEASSPVYSLAPPVANFSVPASIVAGQAVTFTDTSSPQATSWLWFPGDGMPATTAQSPTVTFPSAGPKVVVLVATNGSGSSTKTTTVNVLLPAASTSAASLAVRSLDRQRDGRLALDRVEVGTGSTLVLRRLEGEGEAVAFLRFLDADDRVVVERRLVLAEGEEARHDLSAWGATGAFRIELVGPEGLDAAVEELAIPFGGPEEPVRPGRPRGAGIR